MTPTVLQYTNETTGALAFAIAEGGAAVLANGRAFNLSAAWELDGEVALDALPAPVLPVLAERALVKAEAEGSLAVKAQAARVRAQQRLQAAQAAQATPRMDPFTTDPVALELLRSFLRAL